MSDDPRIPPPNLTIRVIPAESSLSLALGDRLLDACDEHPDPPIPFSCRSATCATCRVRVVSGASALGEPEDEELALLEAIGAGSDERLACQVVRLAEGAVVLEVEDA